MQTQTQNIIVEAVQPGGYSSTRTAMAEVQEVVQEQNKMLFKKEVVGVETVTSVTIADKQLQQQAVSQQQTQDKPQKHQEPAINLAPPVTATTPAAPSTPSWASLFINNSSISNSSTAPSASANILATNSSSSSYAKKPVAKVAPYEVLAPVTPSTPLVTPGALSYSAASAQNLPPPSSSSSTSTAAAAKKSNASSADQTQSQRNKVANLDEFSLKFAKFLRKYKNDWTPISLRPRGLTNRSNYCYINSILQALLGCSPLFNLIRSIPKQAAKLCEVKTPTVNAM